MVLGVRGLDAWDGELNHVGIDRHHARLTRGRHTVVPIRDVVGVSHLHQLDRGQRRHRVHRGQDALPARHPIAPAQLRQWPEVRSVLARVAYRANDVVDGHDPDSARPTRGLVGSRISVVQGGQRLPVGQPAYPRAD